MAKIRVEISSLGSEISGNDAKAQALLTAYFNARGLQGDDDFELLSSQEKLDRIVLSLYRHILEVVKQDERDGRRRQVMQDIETAIEDEYDFTR